MFPFTARPLPGLNAYGYAEDGPADEAAHSKASGFDSHTDEGARRQDQPHNRPWPAAVSACGRRRQRVSCFLARLLIQRRTGLSGQMYALEMISIRDEYLTNHRRNGDEFDKLLLAGKNRAEAMSSSLLASWFVKSISLSPSCGAPRRRSLFSVSGSWVLASFGT